MMLIATRITKSLLLVSAVLWLSSIASDTAAEVAERHPPILSLSGKDLHLEEGIAGTDSFDFSPDASRIAVEFRVRHDNGTVSIVVAQWHLSSKTLLRTCRIDELTSEQARNLTLTSEIRYSSDGQYLVVLTGPSVRVVSVDNCSPRQIFVPAPLKPIGPDGPTIRQFDVADSRVAILTDSADYGGRGIRALKESESTIQTFNIVTGDKEGDFSLPGVFRNMAMSPDGRQIALTGVFRIPSDPKDEDIRVFSVKDGEILQRIQSGFRWSRGVGNGIPIAFLSSTQLIVAPSQDHYTFGYGGRSLKIFSVDSAKLARKIGWKNFGPLGILSVSKYGQFAATVNYWESGLTMMSDWRRHGRPAQLLLIRLGDGKVFSIKAPVEQGAGALALDQYCLRFSADASYLALFQEFSVEVYDLRPYTSTRAEPTTRHLWK